ncbi:MAG: helix-turn-helix domain-containing protein [Lachnospiraceae bacterium]|nr:helix-turn-helix domain-containing protein [Lachnospiraceae bacterium]
MFTIPTIDMIATGKNITMLRKQAGMSVKDIQDIFGFATPQAIYKWQHGTAIPTIDNLVILACVLHVTIDELIVVAGSAGTACVSSVAGVTNAQISA